MTENEVRQIVREEIAALGLVSVHRRKHKPHVYRITWDTTLGLQGITDDDMARWQAAYPAVPIPAAIRQIECWLVENPKRLSELRNFGKFMNNWFAKDQLRADGRRNGLV